MDAFFMGNYSVFKHNAIQCAVSICPQRDIARHDPNDTNSRREDQKWPDGEKYYKTPESRCISNLHLLKIEMQQDKHIIKYLDNMHVTA